MNVVKINKMEITKVKHLFFLMIYVISLIYSLIHISITQNGDGIFAVYVVVSTSLILLFTLVKVFIWVFKNWNNKIGQ